MDVIIIPELIEIRSKLPFSNKNAPVYKAGG